MQHLRFMMIPDILYWCQTSNKSPKATFCFQEIIEAFCLQKICSFMYSKEFSFHCYFSNFGHIIFPCFKPPPEVMKILHSKNKSNIIIIFCYLSLVLCQNDKPAFMMALKLHLSLLCSNRWESWKWQEHAAVKPCAWDGTENRFFFGF